MNVQPLVVGWKEVRNQELSDVISRRQAAGLWTAQVLGELAKQWSKRDLVPGHKAWATTLADVLEEWCDVALLTPEGLRDALRRWRPICQPGSNADSVADDHCQQLVQKALFRDLADILAPPDLDVAGLDQRAREELKKTKTTERLDRLRLTLEGCEKHGLVPMATLGFGAAPSTLARQHAHADDPEYAAYQKLAETEWWTHGEGAALDAVILECLLRAEVAKDLVGLALSGGGIRSASFNLGLLQSLQKDQLLRDVDFLSTVSGGGYVGSFLSSMVHTRDLQMNPSLAKEPPLAPAPTGKQPEDVVKVVRSGSFLNHPTLHLSRYLLGVLLNNMVILSALVAVCTLIALLWRSLDVYPIEATIRTWSHGVIKDWNRPFLPALALLLVWFLISAAYLAIFGPHGRPRFGHPLLVVTGVFFLIGAAVALGTPFLDVPLVASGQDANPPLLDIGNTPAAILLFVVLFGLVPFLKPWRFLASGTQPSGTGEQLIFRALSLILLAGVPFFLVYLLARHDIAYDVASWKWQNPSARRDLHLTDVQYDRWPNFWKRLIKQAELQERGVSWYLWQRLTEAQRQAIEDSLDMPGIQESPIPLDKTAYEHKQAIVAAVNAKVINDPMFIDDVLSHAPPETSKEVLAYVLKRSEHMREGQRLRSLLERYEQKRILDSDKLTLNRLLLEAYYGWAVWERAVVRRSVVIDQDQQCRAYLLGGAALVALLASLLVGLNATSLHGIYRQQLAWLYLNPVAQAKPDPYLRLHELDTTAKGAPCHLITGSLDKGWEKGQGDRPTVQFLFSRRYCGSTFTGFIATKDYQKDAQGGTLDLPTAMAISGAAFSPVRVQNRLIAFLMLILNMRLGQWLPSPRHPARPRRLPILRLLLSLLCFRGIKRRRFWFVTDGGHSENLGLGPLLRRECKLIIVSDAGYDPDYGFDDFVQLYRHARIQGVRFQTLDQSGFIRMDPLVPDKATGMSPHRYVVARIEYPGPAAKWGLLIYVKPSFAGDEAVDLQRYRRLNTKFPHDPTVNQWFDEDQVESYRELGAWIGQRVSEALKAPLGARRGHPLDFEEFVKNFEQEVKERAADRMQKERDEQALPQLAKMLAEHVKEEPPPGKEAPAKASEAREPSAVTMISGPHPRVDVQG